MKNLPFAIENDIAWRLNVRLHRRPASVPFLSGDTFRAAADLVVEENTEFARNPGAQPRLVFCASSRAAELLKERPLPERCVVVVHHGDVNIRQAFCRVMDRRPNVHVFAQNCLVRHPRITPLPIGLEDQWRHQNGVVRDFRKLRKRTVARIPRIAWGFSLGTNPDERWPCYRALWKNPVGTAVPQGINSRLYRKFVHPFMFIASPPGNGADCHRTWEAIYLGIVPIVRRSVMTEYFRAIGMPLLVLDDWRELLSMTEERLSEIYEELRPGFDSETLWFPYWRSRFGRTLEATG